MFSTHPVLDAQCHLDTLLKAQSRWELPRSFDGQMHDPDELNQCAQSMMLESQLGIMQATQCNDFDDLTRRWTHISETALHKSAVTTDGHQVQLPKSYLGRAWKPVLKSKQIVVPIVKRARDGDYQAIQSQCSVVQRQHRRQLHRLQSIVRQMNALNKHFSMGAWKQVCHLWCGLLFFWQKVSHKASKGGRVNTLDSLLARVCIPLVSLQL